MARGGHPTLEQSSLRCPRCRERPGRVGRNGQLGWCYECGVAYRRGGLKMTPEEKAASKARAIERQKETLRLKREFWQDARATLAPPKRPKPTFEPGYLSNGGQMPSMNSRARRLGPHVVGTIRFGRDNDPTRWTTCAGCDFTCTGGTDEQMARAWSKHVQAQRPSRSGPVERVSPAHGDDDSEDEQDSDAA